METTTPTVITVESTVNAPVSKVWEYWTKPEHIMQWCAASDDWHAPKADNDVRVGGKFSTTMAAKDGSFGFDFGGVYDVVEENADKIKDKGPAEGDIHSSVVQKHLPLNHAEN